jgi:hypothetical protein
VERYENYLPGADNNERLAQTQDTWDKWANGLTKAGANLLTTVVGNTAGLVIGLAEGVKQGNLNAVFDNSFSNTLADFNEKLGYQLPNYVSKDEQNENFFQSLDNANFWANDVMGGLSFTLGTIVSEAIWAVSTGGAGNIAKAGLYGAKVGNALNFSKSAITAERALIGLSKQKSFVQKGIENMYRTGAINMQTAKNYATAAKWADTGRFLATTSGNEAGIEALHYKRESRENFYRNFSEMNGREPSKEEVSEFEGNLETSANWVFGANMAILAPSNMAMFGSLFNISSPFKGASKAMNKSIFGVGVEKTAVEGGGFVFKGLEATGKQKALQYGYSALKPMVTEGLWEEGLQGVSSNTAKNWISTTYDPKYGNEAMSLMEATFDGFAEQYGTKQGWKEIGIGTIIGGGSSLFMGGGNFAEIKEFKNAQKYQDEYVAKGLNRFGDNTPLATDLLTRKMMLNSQIKNATERQQQAMSKGDDVGASLAQQDLLIAEIQFRKAIGEDPKELMSKYQTALEALPDSAFEEAGITDRAEHTKGVMEGYKSLLNSHEKASDFADAVLGNTRILGQDVPAQHLKDALVYSMVNGQTAHKAMDNLVKDMGRIVGRDSEKAIIVQADLQRLGKNKQEQIRKLNKGIAQADAEVKSLSAELLKLQASKDETKGAKLQAVQAKLLESTERGADLKTQRETFATELNQERDRNRGINNQDISDTDFDVSVISGEDLANVETKLENIDNLIKSYEGTNHELYYELIDLKKQYLSAKDNFMNYQKSIDAIVNGEMKAEFEKMGGFIGKVFNSKKPLDDYTKEYLENLSKNYTESFSSVDSIEALQDFGVTDEEYKLFKETGEVSDSLLNKVAGAVKSKESLSPRQKEIFDARVNEINALLKPNPNKPNLSPESITEKQIKSLEEEKAVLEQELTTLPKTTQTDNKVKANTLKVGDKFNFNGKEYTVKDINENVKTSAETSISSIETEEGRTINNPSAYGLGTSENWALEITPINEAQENPRIKELQTQINKINAKIQTLKKDQGTLTEAEKVRKLIEDTFAKSYPLLTTDADELLRDKPTQTEIKRYLDLYKNQDKIDLFNLDEFNELQARMQKWFMAQSLPVAGETIADLVELLAQLETVTEQNDTVDEIDVEVLMGDTVEGKESRLATRDDIGQTVGGSVVSTERKGDIFLHHIKAESIINSLLDGTNEAFISLPIEGKNKKLTRGKKQQLTPLLLEQYKSTEGVEFSVDDVKFQVDGRGNMVFNKEAFKKIKDKLNLQPFNSKTGSWSSSDVYEKYPDGIHRKKNSELDTNTNPDLLYESEVGSTVDLFVDMRTEYNSNLVSEALLEIADEKRNTTLSEDLKSRIREKLEITIKNKEGNGATLKAQTTGTVNDYFLYIRKKYADEFIRILESDEGEASIPRKIDLDAQVTVKDMYLGTPILQLDENMKAKDLKISESGLTKVITQGYISEEGVFLSDKTVDTENVSNLYVTNLLKANKGMKIPVVVLEKGKYRFLFPITMVKTSEDKSGLLDQIFQSAESEIDAVKKVNNLLISLDISLRITNLAEQKMIEVKEALLNYTSFTTAVDLAETTYDKSQLQSDATIKVDLENEVISSPKIILDLGSLTLGSLQTNETDASKLRASISDNMLEIERVIRTSVEMPDKGRFVQAFDDQTVDNKGMDIFNRKDVNMIKPLFFDANGNKIGLQGKAVEIIGKDKLLVLREQLIRLEFYEAQIKIAKEKLKATKANLNCK